jgi:hypothetical protein
MTEIHSPCDLIPDDCTRWHRARSGASISQYSCLTPFLFTSTLALRKVYGYIAAPSNAGAQPLLEAAATQERRLEAVGCSALLGLFDFPLHDGAHFTLTGSGSAEEW